MNELIKFPDEFAPAEEKKTEGYGLAYAKALGNIHFQQNGIFETRLAQIRRLRKYAEGTQSTDKYKDWFQLKDGDTSWMNLDFLPPAIIPKFLDIKLGQLISNRYKVTCTPIDAESATIVEEERNRIYANMLLKPIDDKLKEATGLSVIGDGEFVPADEDEFNIYMSMSFKPSLSMAIEEAVDFVMYNNDWNKIEKKLIRDLLVNKAACTRTYFDHNKDIRIAYVDIEKFICPYSQNDNFKDISYAGVVEYVTIQDIAEQNKNLTEDQLKEIAKKCAGQYGNANWNTMWDTYYPAKDFTGREWNNFKVRVLNFEFLSTNTVKYTITKKNGNEYFDKKRSDYTLPTNNKNEKELIANRVKQRYEGRWIVGTDYMLSYKMSENMQFPKVKGTYHPETELSYKFIMPNAYEMVNQSLVERMIPFADQIVFAHLKMQQVLAFISPEGNAIDMSSLEEIQLGKGKDDKMSPLEIYQMFRQTGSFPYSSLRADGSQINRPPIEPIRNEVSGKINSLIQMYEYNLKMLRDVTGINEVADASAPSSNALVGTSQIALAQAGNATKELQYNFLDLAERVAKDVVLKIQDVIDDDGEISGYYNAIGEEAIRTIQLSKKSHNGEIISLAEFGIKIELLPDDIEKQELNQLISVGLQNGDIRLEDAIMIREQLKSNVKKAAQMLILRKKKYAEEKQKESAALQEQNAQVQAQSGQAVAQAQAEADKVLTQNKAMLLEQEYKLKMELSAQEHIQKLSEIALQNKGKEVVAEKTHEGNLAHTAYKDAITPREVG